MKTDVCSEAPYRLGLHIFLKPIRIFVSVGFVKIFNKLFGHIVHMMQFDVFVC